MGPQRLAGRPRPADGRHPRLRPRRLHPDHPRRPVRPGRAHVLGAVLRRVRVPDVPQGPLRPGRADHAREADLGPGGAVRRPPHRPPAGPRRHLPARQARVGRGHGPGRRDDQLLRWSLVRPGLERAADLARGAQGGQLLRRSPPSRRPGRCGGLRVLRVRQPVQPGQHGDVVRRHRRRGPAGGPGPVQRRREGRLRAGADRRRRPVLGLAVLVGAGHPPHHRGEGPRAGRRDLEVPVLDDVQAVPEDGRRGPRLDLRPARRPPVDLPDPRVRRGIPEYVAASKAYAPQTIAAINAADQDRPTRDPVPYTGLQFVGIPEFQDLGTRVSQQISAAIAGQQTADEALDEAQSYAETVGESYQQSGGDR